VKITRVQPVIVHAGKGNWVFVKIDTDTGISGLGEGSLLGKAQTIAAGIGDAARYLIGRSPLDPEWIWNLIFESDRYRGGPILTTVISAIDLACWDILGKYHDKPVWQLLGDKVRDAVPLYGRLCKWGTPEENFDANLALLNEKGYRAIKVGFELPKDPVVDEKAVIQDCIDNLSRLREAGGPDFDLCLDTHAMLPAASVIRLARALEPLNLQFLEEPVAPEDIDGLQRVRDNTSIPLATGERLMPRFAFKPIIDRHLVDFVQPDICHCGGITEMKKIAALAAAKQIRIAPHNPSSHSELATMASVHAAAVMPNFASLEHPADHPPWRYELFNELVEVQNGAALLPDRPGLGLTLRDDIVDAHPYEPYTRHSLFTTDGRPTPS